MKKLFTFLFAVFFALQMNAQTTDTCCYYSMQKDSCLWKTTNANGQLIEKGLKRINWLTFHPEYEKTEYIYNANGDVVTSTTYWYINGAWSFHERTTYTYNLNNLLDTETDERWWASNSWEFTWREKYTYDINGNIVNKEFESFSNGVWNSGSNLILTYDINNNLISRTHQHFSSGIFNNSGRNLYIYDLNNNLLEDKWQSWNVNASMFNDHSRDVYVYNTNNLVLSKTSEQWQNGAWNYSSNNDYTYDLNNNLLTTKNWFQTSSGIPQPGYYHEYTYDANNNEVDFIAGTNSNSIINFGNLWNKRTRTYDASNNLILTTYYNANQATSSWIFDKMYLCNGLSINFCDSLGILLDTSNTTLNMAVNSNILNSTFSQNWTVSDYLTGTIVATDTSSSVSFNLNQLDTFVVCVDYAVQWMGSSYTCSVCDTVYFDGTMWMLYNVGQPLSIEEQSQNKTLLKITDILGRELEEIKNTPLFYIYDDGTVEKKIIIK